MITKAQAEQAFHERYDHPRSTIKPEIRNLEMVEIDASQVETDDNLISVNGLAAIPSGVKAPATSSSRNPM